MGRTEPDDPAGLAVARLLAAGGDSVLATVLRGGLIGLRAALQDAADRDSRDPGTAASQEVLDWLDDLLSDSQRGRATRSQAEAASARLPPAWSAFLDSLTKNPQVARQFDPDTIRTWQTRSAESDAGSADLWRAMQLRLLRLPEPLARRLRGELWDIAAQPPSADPWLEVGPEEPGGEILLASFDGNGAGVRTAADPQLDDEVLDSLGDLRGSAGSLPAEATELAQICSAMLAVSSVDDDLWLCLESLQFTRSVRLDEDGRRRLRREVAGRLRQFARYPPGSAEAVRALLAVDEAVHAVVHLPVAARGSWWDRLWHRSRVLVEQQAARACEAGQKVEVRPLILGYQDIKGQTANDVAVDIGGQPGDVLACLRMYGRIAGQELPGRVLYRASQ
jgi:hypothetical protein